ncbi:cytochrome P450 [Pisolithus marmoratus]|nr:cytochrome P450 [Pisolithus marmoratus]
MTSYTLTTAQVSALIVGLGFMFITHVMSKKGSTHPPTVPSLLPWIGSAFGFVTGPNKFLNACHARFGPVFKFMLGGHNILVVGTPESIHNAHVADHRILTSRIQHYSHFQAFGSNPALYATIFDTFTNKFFPVLDRRLAKRAVDDVTTGYAEVVFQRLMLLSKGESVSLRRSVTEPIYVGVTSAFLGNKFTPDSYDDWVTFFDSIPTRLVQRPFWSPPSTRARERLLQHFITCLQGANPDNDDDKLAGDFARIVRENDISPEVGSHAMLAVMLALHTNLFNVIFWLFSWLMADPRALSSLRDDIDKAIREEFGNLQTFIAEASPRKLESPAFALVNSAILEAARLSTLQSGIRQAECDFELKDGDSTIPVRKGEYVLIYPRATQQDEAFYPDSHKFVSDRFVNSEHPGEITATSGKPYFAFGEGKHICKGRYLALYEMKVLTILYLHLFDIIPASTESRSSGWESPQPSPQSIGTIHPTDKVFVKLRPRATLERV